MSQQETISIFNFYRRYKWKAADFTRLQQAFVTLTGAFSEAMCGAAALEGGDPTVVSGTTISVTACIAVSATGDILVDNDGENIVLPTGDATYPTRHLIVARPVATDTEYIVRPTTPRDLVPLRSVRGMTLVAITGTAGATPEYPSKEDGDVILCGVRVAAAATSITNNDLDLSVREVLGMNSRLAKNVVAFDDRCRVYKSGVTVGIKPSQTLSPQPKLFIYPGKVTPSIFPKTGGVFTESDALVNFTTGAITGGDGDSPDFTPTIPSAGNFIWALISLTTTDLLSVKYGVVGTYAQCKTAMKSMVSSGAGAVPLSNDYKLAYVLLGSTSGSAITELEIVDARSFNSSAAPSRPVRPETALTVANTPYTMTGDEDVITLDCSGGNIDITMPSKAASLGRTYTFSRLDSDDTKRARLTGAGSDTFQGGVTYYDLDEAYQSENFYAAASVWKKGI